MLSFVDCALILVVVEEVPVVGFASCCGVSNVCRVRVVVVEDNDESQGF